MSARTWADGFGLWYAEAESADAAARAIEHELEIRGEKHLGARIIVQHRPEYGPNVWREADYAPRNTDHDPLHPSYEIRPLRDDVSYNRPSRTETGVSS